MTDGKRIQDNLPELTAELSEAEAEREAQVERNAARELYRVSLWSPVLTVLALLVMPRLLSTGYRSRQAFVRWHTAQWTLLTLVALFVGVTGWGTSDSALILIAVGGWYLGNLTGSRQVKRGDCWLWRWLYETAELPRPWAVKPDAAPAPAASAPSTTPAEALPSPVPAAPGSTVPAEAQAAFEKGMALALQGQQQEAVACFMTTFRDGTPDLRHQSVAELEKLGEVEVF